MMASPGDTERSTPADADEMSHRSTIVEIRCRTVLNRVPPPMPFRWSANPYRGCAHACYYCYARPSHIDFDLGGGDEFERIIFAKVNAPEVLRAELRRPGWQREPVSIGTIVDPYQPAEGRFQITRRMLHEFAVARTPATIITKNSMVQRDVDVLRELRARAGCTVFISLTSLDAELLRRMEPGTPPPLKRLQTVRRLVQAGIPAGIMAAPLLPGITDSAGSLAMLAAAAAEHRACFFLSGALHLGPNVEQWFRPFLQRERPDLLPLYRRLYPRAHAPRSYVERLHARVADLRAEYGLPSSLPPLGPTEEPTQLSLGL